MSFGGNPAQKQITTWFRREFVCPELAPGEKLVLLVCVDDGAVVYLNGDGDRPRQHAGRPGGEPHAGERKDHRLR